MIHIFKKGKKLIKKSYISEYKKKKKKKKKNLIKFQTHKKILSQRKFQWLFLPQGNKMFSSIQGTFKIQMTIL